MRIERVVFDEEIKSAGMVGVYIDGKRAGCILYVDGQWQPERELPLARVEHYGSLEEIESSISEAVHA